MSQLFTWGGQSTGVSALASSLPKKSQGWSPSEWTGWISLQSKGLSGVFSNRQCIKLLKSRNIILPSKVCLVKGMIFPVVMYESKSWTTKKAEHWRTDAFELWCWGRLLRVLWTVRRSNQSFIRKINSGYSLEGLMLKLKLQHFGHLIWRTDSLVKTLMLGKIKAGGKGDDRGWDGWIASLTQWTWVWASSRRWWRTG